jgi:hypothetical protein
LDRIQPIVRLGYRDTNVHDDVAAPATIPIPSGGYLSDEVWHYEVGVNYYLQQQETRLALTFSDFDYDNAPNEYDTTMFAQVSF